MSIEHWCTYTSMDATRQATLSSSKIFSVHMIGTMEAVNVHLPVGWVGVCGDGGLIGQISILLPRCFEI